MNMNETAIPFTAVYVIDREKVLLILRAADRLYCPNELLGVGGKIEPGETSEESAVRECFEETGLMITNPQFRGTFSYWANNNIGTLYLFTSQDFSGTLKTNSEEGMLEWYPILGIENLPRLAEHQKFFLPDLLAGDTFFYCGHAVYEGGKLKSYYDNKEFFKTRS